MVTFENKSTIGIKMLACGSDFIDTNWRNCTGQAKQKRSTISQVATSDKNVSSSLAKTSEEGVRQCCAVKKTKCA
jgi:hypothetical protein